MVDETQTVSKNMPQLEYASVLNQTWKMIWTNPVFVLLSVLFSLPGKVAQEFIEPTLETLVGYYALVGILCFLSQAAQSCAVLQILQGGRPTFSGSLRCGMSRIFPLLGMAVVMLIGVQLASLLLIVPGIMLTCLWSVAVPACTLERLGPMESLARSEYLAKGNLWRIFGLLIFAGLMYLAVSLLTGVLLFYSPPELSK